MKPRLLLFRLSGLTALFLLVVVFAFSCGKGGSSSDIGAEGKEFLLSEPYSKILIEIHAISGYYRDENVESLLLPEIERIVEKPGGISVQFFDDVPASTDEIHPYTVDDVEAIESSVRKYRSEGDTAVLHVLILDGKAADAPENSEYFAFVYGASSVVVFRDAIVRFANLYGYDDVPPEQLICHVESTVILHEFGHILGLVGHGLPIVNPHEDPEHEGHCVNENCIMFHGFEEGSCVTLIFNRLAENNEEIHVFDENCREDLNEIE